MGLEISVLVDYKRAISRVKKGMFRVIGDIFAEKLTSSENFFVVVDDCVYNEAVAIAKLKYNETKTPYKRGGVEIHYHIIDDIGHEVYSSLGEER